MLRIAAGRPGRLAVQVINHGNRLSSVAASRPGGGWLRLAPDADGYWTGPLRPGRPGPGQAPGGTAAALAGGAAGRPAGGTRFSVRITDVAGHQVVLTGVSLLRTLLRATTWMYQDPGPARGPGGPRARPRCACQQRRRGARECGQLLTWAPGRLAGPGPVNGQA